jgi:hypothetical protein
LKAPVNETLKKNFKNGYGIQGHPVCFSVPGSEAIISSNVRKL